MVDTNKEVSVYKSYQGLTLREIKDIKKSKKNLDDFRRVKIEPTKRKIEETYNKAAGSIEFKQLNEEVFNMYASGKKSITRHNDLLKKIYENNYIYNLEKYVINEKTEVREFKLPKIGENGYGNSVPPHLYVKREIDANFSDKVGVGFNLPPQFIYSGTIDTIVNLDRKQGFIPEQPYYHQVLDNERGAYANTGLRFSNELEALTYVYDHMPYAYKFGSKRWLGSLLRANNGAGKIIGWDPGVTPLKLYSCEHITLSSEQIPFEIEGKLMVTDVRHVIKTLNKYRSGDPTWYNYGDCDDPRKFILHMYCESVGKSDEDIDFMLSENNYDKLVNMLDESVRLSVEYTDEKEESLAKTAYYYASKNEREKILNDNLLTKEEGEIIEMSANMNMKGMMADMKLSMIERTNVINEVEEYWSKEDSRIDKFNMMYMYEIKRERTYDPLNYSSNVIDDDNDDFFSMFETNEDYEVPKDEDVEGEPVFTVPEKQYNETYTDPVFGGRRIWDPGILEPELMAQEPKTSVSILGLL